MTDIIEITVPNTITVEPGEVEVVEIGYVSGGYIPVPGPAGPKGDKGDPGEPGPAGTLAESVTQIASPSLTWSVSHQLGRRPIVVCHDIDGFEIWGDVQTTSTTVDVNWAVPVAGALLLY